MLRLRTDLPGILSAYPVMLAYLYGSVAEGRATPSSDVDLALVFDADSDLTSYERIRIELNITSEMELRCGIAEADVRSIDIAPLKVQGRVITAGILIYSRDESFRIGYENRIRSRYFDYLPTAHMIQKEFYKRIEQEGFNIARSRPD